MPRVVNHNVKAVRFGHDLLDGSIDRVLRLDIHLDGTEIGFLVERELPYRLDLLGVFACRPAYACIHGVPCY